ncbi:hypothetical protein N7533_008921 [Penicillium manginii]|uniref:uncharacterized protein n=1 Tax=Penicillium manginii TaxID=203109 RepID=UPI002548EFB2|nr:uncharacterized protein N7533_008921 [Penicillium manginii]KAJ5744051.1 hypothetical protein N7533_008921 [Penicillium manginii]
MDMDMEDTDEGHGLPTRRAIIIITVPNQDLPTSATTPLHLINPSPPRRELQQHPQSQVSATHYHANRPPAADVNANATRKPKKRKRKHNQLGLTPKTEDHESSEDEEDADEESKLAQGGAGGSESAPLQFSYKGRTATLQSSADIAAWIAERRKKFPTAERVEEKKKVAQEAKDARDAVRREKMNERAKMNGKAAAAGAGDNNKDNKEKSKGIQKPAADNLNADPALDAAMKAQRKADKIRRNLDREQKRFAKAEAEAEAARLKVAALQKQLGSDQNPMQKDVGGDENGTGTDGHVVAGPNVDMLPELEIAEASDPMTIDLTDKPLEPGALTAAAKPVPTGVGLGTIDVADQVDGPMDLVSEAEASRHGSDWTSSSGSESSLDSDRDSGSESESDSDSDSDGDSAPEQASSRRQGPEKVLPPPREGKKQLCRHFARSGKCNRGDQCSFSHDVGERRKAKPEKKEKGRKGLLSAVSTPDPAGNPPLHYKRYTNKYFLQLLDRQKEDEDRRAMEVIAWLGENGLLEEPKGSTCGTGTGTIGTDAPQSDIPI